MELSIGRRAKKARRQYLETHLADRRNWSPSTIDAEGRPLFSEPVVVQLCLARLHELGHPATLDKSHLARENLRAVTANPDWRLGYELIPEIAAFFVLRSIGTPSSNQYALPYHDGGSEAFDMDQHPVYDPVIRILERQVFHCEALIALADCSAAVDAINKALNSGSRLQDCAFCCVPLGLFIKNGKLEIKPGCEID